MKTAVYGNIPAGSAVFDVEYNEQAQMTGLRNPKDPNGMNWVRMGTVWGEVQGDYDLEVNVERRFTEQDTLAETYIFRNNTEFDIYTMGTKLSVSVPLPDFYTEAAFCMKQCCHAHVWCGGSSSYIMALRMGGEAPHLGIILREGGLQGYSLDRNKKIEENISSSRGIFRLHPENFHLKPGEVYQLTWEIFWFDSREEFQNMLASCPGYLEIRSEHYILFQGESIDFTAGVSEGELLDGLTVKRDSKEIPFDMEKGKARIIEIPERCGEYSYTLYWRDKTAKTSFCVVPQLMDLIKRRCHFIAEKQQCMDQGSHLYGAYLIYDNEEKQQYYSHLNDHNGGRERVGMGVLLAGYLQKNKDEVLEQSLDKFEEYVLRELFNEQTGEVFNDMPRCNDYIRLYNYPWMCRFFLELYQLKGEDIYLDRYMKCAEYFYQAGGNHFYGIGMPMCESVEVFQKTGRNDDVQKLLRIYTEMGDYILACGENYPSHEVEYEQSIVAPASIYMCELYRITGEEKYRKGARFQLSMLELFHGDQPDYHLNQVAIRHWDGYWFGKRRILGDTFPHYWSVLSGVAFWGSEDIMGTEQYTKRAENAMRGVLSMFREDGSASCAMVYPMSVNGEKAHFYDPWANDQDWGLFYIMKKKL